MLQSPLTDLAQSPATLLSHAVARETLISDHRMQASQHSPQTTTSTPISRNWARAKMPVFQALPPSEPKSVPKTLNTSSKALTDMHRPATNRPTRRHTRNRCTSVLRTGGEWELRARNSAGEGVISAKSDPSSRVVHWRVSSLVNGEPPVLVVPISVTFSVTGKLGVLPLSRRRCRAS